MQSSPSGTSFTESMLESSRTKLRLLGILDEQIQAIETTRKTTTHLTIYAPLGGTVIEKNIRVGQYVAEGDLLYRIANLDPKSTLRNPKISTCTIEENDERSWDLIQVRFRSW